MIKTIGVTKRFGDIVAVDHINAEIKEGSVFGLIGTNGAGKSTFLRLLSGILRPDEGEILIDNENVYENTVRKEEFFYISDDQHYLSNAALSDMIRFYRLFYPQFDEKRAGELLSGFGLDADRKIRTFSKGMKKQLSVILGLSAKTRYLFCDETFDGLDPVMRQTVKSLFAQDMADRGLTPVIASHNLRELEDICDHVGLLHKGGILFSKDLEDMKTGIHKIQCVPSSIPSVLTEKGTIANASETAKVLFPAMDILLCERHGSILTMTVRGAEDEIRHKMNSYETIFYEIVPLTLEEIFISETEVKGYDIKKLVL